MMYTQIIQKCNKIKFTESICNTTFENQTTGKLFNDVWLYSCIRKTYATETEVTLNNFKLQVNQYKVNRLVRGLKSNRITELVAVNAIIYSPFSSI